MDYTVLLHPEAEKEYLSSILWYESRFSGLGDRFEEAVEKCIISITQHPFQFAEKRKGYREVSIKYL